jgi:transcriptional regulator with XRE-family HTH domain
MSKKVDFLEEREVVIGKNGIAKLKVKGKSKWTEDLGDLLVYLVGQGMTQRELCKLAGINTSTLCEWKKEGGSSYKKEFALAYADAYKYEGADNIEAECKEIADDASRDMYEGETKFGIVQKPNIVPVNRAKVQIDVRQRQMAVRNRDKYGKSENLTQIGAVESSFTILKFGDGTNTPKKEEKKEVLSVNRISNEN